MPDRPIRIWPFVFLATCTCGEMTGKTELIDRDHRYDSELCVTCYGPSSDVNPADGFPDEGA